MFIVVLQQLCWEVYKLNISIFQKSQPVLPTYIIIKLSHFKDYLILILELLDYNSKPSFLVKKRTFLSPQFPLSEISALLPQIKSGSLILLPTYHQVVIFSWWLYVQFTSKNAFSQFPLPFFLHTSMDKVLLPFETR